MLLVLQSAPATPRVAAPPDGIAFAATTPLPVEGARLADLVEAASLPLDGEARRAARDTLFHEVVPVLRERGEAAPVSDMTGLQAALRTVACTDGPLRSWRARASGGLAIVSAAGRTGACSWLMRRSGAGWEPLMALGWTLER